MLEKMIEEPCSPKYSFDLQASPKCLEMIGWGTLRKIANYLSNSWDEGDFYPERWFLGTPAEKAAAPENIKVTFLEWKGVPILVVPYLDKKGIRVFHFDPNRELHGFRAGHHRV